MPKTYPVQLPRKDWGWLDKTKAQGQTIPERLHEIIKLYRELSGE